MAEGGDTIQAPAKCEFCEDSIEIRWKCLNCDLFLCQFCTNRIHSRSKASQNHHIINIKDLGTEETANLIRKIQIDSLTCSTHKEQKCVSYCNVCKHLICVHCLKDVCKEHVTEDLVQKYETKLSEIKVRRNAYASEIQVIKDKLNCMKKIKDDMKSTKDELRKQIQYKEDEIQQAVSRYSEGLKNQVEQLYKPLESKIDNRQAFLENRIEKNVNDENTFSKVLNSLNVLDVIESDVSHEDLICQELFTNEEEFGLPKFQLPSTKLTGFSWKNLFGDFMKCQFLELLKSYKTKSSVFKILCHNENNLILAENNILKQVKIDENNITIVNENRIEVFDVCTHPSSEIFFISTTNSELKVYNAKNKCETLSKSFSPLLTLGIDIDKTGKLYLGLTDSHNDKITKSSIRKVVQLTDHSLNKIKDYEFYKKERLFTWPKRITSFVDNVYIVDIINSSNEGKVVALNSIKGSLKWIYKGSPSATGRDKFYPTCIAVTLAGNILISDCDNHAIHMLNNSGEIIGLQDLSVLNIKLPFSICIDRTSYIWIGSLVTPKSDNNIHTFKIQE